MKWISFFSYLIITSVFVACDNKPPYSTIQGPEIPGIGSKWPYNDINWLGDLGGRLSLGMDGPNLPVTQKNADTVSIRVIHRVLSITYEAKEKLGVPSLSASARILGSEYGFVLFSGSFSGTESDYAYEYSATFYDYSDSYSGFIFGGKLNYKGNSTFNPKVYKPYHVDTILNGTLEFSGKYRGSIAFSNLNTLETDSELDYTGLLLINSYKKFFNYNLIFRTSILEM